MYSVAMTKSFGDYQEVKKMSLITTKRTLDYFL